MIRTVKTGCREKLVLRQALDKAMLPLVAAMIVVVAAVTAISGALAQQIYPARAGVSVARAAPKGRTRRTRRAA